MSRDEGRILISHDQKWFQLGTIISISLSIHSIIIGEQLARKYGAGQAICSILVGNLILWVIAMAVISMASEDRSNAIENVKIYLGKYGAIFMWLILIVSLINWFVLQINAVIPSIGIYFGEEQKGSLVRLGAGIGLFITLLSIGGIRLIKRLTVTTSPFIFCYYIYAIIQSDYSISSIDSWGLSIPSIISTILILLPGSINLPTLFRHSRSKADSYLGLTLMVLLISFFEISTIWMKFTDNGNIVYLGSKYSFFSIATLVFIILTLIYINLLNIYFASACWETYVPRFEGAKGYAIIGLMGTAAYTFIQIYTPLLFIEDLTNCYLASLGIVLLSACLTQIIVRHRPRKFEKAINGFCWFIGCVVSTSLVVQNVEDGIHPLLMGVGTSALVFLCIIFIEETTWSARKILFKNE